MSVIGAKLRRVGLPGPMFRRVSLGGGQIEVLSLVGGLLLWEAGGRLLGQAWFPPFSVVIAALGKLVSSGVIIGNLTTSLTGLVIGFSIAVVAGLTIGALMGLFKDVERALSIYVYALFMSPSIVFIPIFFAIFGLSDLTRIAVIVKYALFIIIINTHTGIRAVGPNQLEMARSFGATPWQRFQRVLLPASMPITLAGIRLGMGRAVKGMINGEMFIAVTGLGDLAIKYGTQFNAANVLAVSLVILAVALVAVRVVYFFEQRVTHWVTRA